MSRDSGGVVNPVVAGISRQVQTDDPRTGCSAFDLYQRGRARFHDHLPSRIQKPRRLTPEQLKSGRTIATQLAQNVNVTSASSSKQPRYCSRQDRGHLRNDRARRQCERFSARTRCI
jgi:hypothetical protein